MKELYIAVDPGKGNTKVAIYYGNLENKQKKPVHICKFATRLSDGDFRDDSIGNNTFLAKYEGKVYKIGRNALRRSELNTDKMTEIHRLCTLSAIAMFCDDSTNEDDVTQVHAAIGIPVKTWQNVGKRVAYKDYMMPNGVITMHLKYPNSDRIMVKRFCFVTRHVYPESQGAIFLKKMDPDIPIAVIDIGDLNINFTIWSNGDLDENYSTTSEQGGSILLSELAATLSTEFSRVNEQEVLKALLRKERMLIPNRPNEEISRRSHEIIEQFLHNHVMAIRRTCDAKHWSLDFLQLVCIGGTAGLLRKEIKEIFGEQTYLPPNAELANCVGFLRRMCATELDIIIPIPDFEDPDFKEQVSPSIPGQTVYNNI